jgi:signal transduction histidine kinase
VTGWQFGLLAAWLASLAVLAGWWLFSRTRTDIWRALPVPAALLGPDGKARRTTGPPAGGDLTLASSLPAPGLVTRSRAADGTPLALSGVRGGALALALSPDPIADRRERSLSELAPRLAHDLNTPLSAMRGHLDLMARQPIPEEARTSLNVCQAETERMIALTADLLALTRLRAGTARRGVEHAGALAEEAAAALLTEADESHADLQVDVPTDRVLVEVAAEDLIRALRNLIANALRHGLSADRRAVRVAVTADAVSVRFAVADSGPGLDAGELARLCEPLARGRRDGSTGSGLGLAIVAEVLAAHGSELQVEPADGDGACLSFDLPRYGE